MGRLVQCILSTRLLELINLATTEIVSTAFAVAAIWVAIDRGMNVPLTKGILRCLTGTSTRKRTAAAGNHSSSDLEYPNSRHSGWWREVTLDADSAHSHCKDSGTASNEKADKPAENTYRLPGLLSRLRQRRPEGQATV